MPELEKMSFGGGKVSNVGLYVLVHLLVGSWLYTITTIFLVATYTISKHSCFSIVVATTWL